ncbi:hypothetical protein MXM81_11095 [Serratia plymuthica]|uniref:hypothetical protein n=1 Tax=Serratia plymuthica TaxID=82996 RepID=UPI002DB98BF6|nr:hypothetical protein [Serratia plymuthica]MEB6539633.1 hypothetical protein [Serratia plymuthica]
MVKVTGGQAFPRQQWEYDGQNNVLQYQEAGMTLRDYFAGKAMQSIPLSLDKNEQQLIANAAYRMADAMLEARK